MPVIQIFMHKGRTKQQKEEIIAQVTRTMETVAGAKPVHTQVVIIEVEKENWGFEGKPCA